MRRTAVLACLVTACGGLTALAPAAAASNERDPAGAPQPPENRFQKVTLNDRPGEPMSLAVLPDGRVLHTARTGAVRIHDPRTGLNVLAAEIEVYQHDEEGLQGVAVDPQFQRNGWVYLYYSPPLDTPIDDPSTPEINEGDAPTEGTPADWKSFEGYLQLSRFQLVGNELDLSSEEVILQVPSDRGICCHVGGQIDFDSKGNLYLSTGDDTNPFESDGYAPLDDREDRNPAFDARRSAGNTNDLRGKLLRIRPKKGGGYTIPEGNLFKPGRPRTRPEIYAMGLRNPFRFAVDRQTDVVYMGDYSPDAPEPDPQRGPAGYGRWMVIDEPANYGWPFCITPNMPYRAYNFATEEPGRYFNCYRPENTSPYNDGLRFLPGVVHPEVWYTYGEVPLFPELEQEDGGIGPMGGPAYDYQSKNPSRTKFPSYYDGVPLFYEWTRDYIKEFHLGRRNRVEEIRPFLPGTVFDNPMDMEFGPDGALYVLEYGTGYFAELPEAQLSRIDFVRGNRTPVVEVSTDDETVGLAPLTVSFSSEGTQDPDGDRLLYEWDFDADGRVDSREQNPTFTYEENGIFDATLKVTDSTGRIGRASVEVIVGNQVPVIELILHAEGGTFEFGDVVDFEVRITDDEPVKCENVTVAYVLGHEDHGHPLSGSVGCEGRIITSDQGHAGAGDLAGVFNAVYTDDPVDEDVPPLTADVEVVLQPGQATP